MALLETEVRVGKKRHHVIVGLEQQRHLAAEGAMPRVALPVGVRLAGAELEPDFATVAPPSVGRVDHALEEPSQEASVVLLRRLSVHPVEGDVVERQSGRARMAGPRPVRPAVPVTTVTTDGSSPRGVAASRGPGARACVRVAKSVGYDDAGAAAGVQGAGWELGGMHADAARWTGRFQL